VAFGPVGEGDAARIVMLATPARNILILKPQDFAEH
jgi:hypothetical protein